MKRKPRTIADETRRLAEEVEEFRKALNEACGPFLKLVLRAFGWIARRRYRARLLKAPPQDGFRWLVHVPCRALLLPEEEAGNYWCPVCSRRYRSHDIDAALTDSDGLGSRGIAWVFIQNSPAVRAFLAGGIEGARRNAERRARFELPDGSEPLAPISKRLPRFVPR